MTNKRVLVVDDDATIATTLGAVLESEGYQVATALGGAEAIDRGASFAPDFLLSDISMPGVDGVTAALRILAIVPDCKVLFISGVAHTVEGLLEQASERGLVFDLVAKPISPTDLLRKIAEMLSQPTRALSVDG